MLGRKQGEFRHAPGINRDLLLIKKDVTLRLTSWEERKGIPVFLHFDLTTPSGQICLTSEIASNNVTNYDGLWDFKWVLEPNKGDSIEIKHGMPELVLLRSQPYIPLEQLMPAPSTWESFYLLGGRPLFETAFEWSENQELIENYLTAVIAYVDVVSSSKVDKKTFKRTVGVFQKELKEQYKLKA